jgi:hypothetical protein
MKSKTKILCYSGRVKCNSERIKEVEYTIVNMNNGVYKRDINKRIVK